MHRIPQTSGRRREETYLAVVRTVHAAAKALCNADPAVPAGAGATTLSATRAYIEARLNFLGEPADLITLLDPIAKGAKYAIWRRHFHNAHTLVVDGVLIESGTCFNGAPRFVLSDDAKGGTSTSCA